MMKPKAALVKDGFTEPNGKVWTAGMENSRGRLSAAGIERCKQLSAEGWQIEGYALVAQPTGSTAPREVEKVKVQTGEKVIADIPINPLRDEAVWEAYANVDGKVQSVGMRTVDNVCGNSLTYCPCKSPRVWVDHNRQAVVNFKPRA